MIIKWSPTKFKEAFQLDTVTGSLQRGEWGSTEILLLYEEMGIVKSDAWLTGDNPGTAITR